MFMIQNSIKVHFPLEFCELKRKRVALKEGKILVKFQEPNIQSAYHFEHWL